jgi:hypothetical protein
MHIAATDGSYALAEAEQQIIPELKGRLKIMVKIIQTVPDLNAIGFR